MRRPATIALFVTVFFAVFAALPLAAQDDGESQRKGFFIGYGLGPGITTGDPDTKVGLAAEFKMGATVGESVLVYYNARGNTFGGEFVDLNLSAFHGLGVAYEVPSAPGFSINGGVGISSWWTFTDGEIDADVGFGLAGGFGYEFIDHFVFNVGATWGQPVGGLNVVNLMAGIAVLSH